MIVARGDRDSWRKDLDEIVRMGRAGGMPEGYAEQMADSVPAYLSGFDDGQMKAWLNKQIMLAFASMMLMAETMGYDTAPMEGFEQDKVCEMLKLPMSYWVVALLAVGHLKGEDKWGRRAAGHAAHGFWRGIRQTAEVSELLGRWTHLT